MDSPSDDVSPSTTVPSGIRSDSHSRAASYDAFTRMSDPFFPPEIRRPSGSDGRTGGSRAPPRSPGGPDRGAGAPGTSPERWRFGRRYASGLTVAAPPIAYAARTSPPGPGARRLRTAAVIRARNPAAPICASTGCSIYFERQVRQGSNNMVTRVMDLTGTRPRVRVDVIPTTSVELLMSVAKFGVEASRETFEDGNTWF